MGKWVKERDKEEIFKIYWQKKWQQRGKKSVIVLIMK